MKRFCSLLLTFALIFSMTGCLGARRTEPSNKPYVIGFSQVGSESDWRVANTKSMTSTFGDDSNYELIMDNARQEQENQFAAVRRFILEGVDFIIIAPTVEEGWETILQEIRDANIPVIIMDRSVAVDAVFFAVLKPMLNDISRKLLCTKRCTVPAAAGDTVRIAENPDLF